MHTKVKKKSVPLFVKQTFADYGLSADGFGYATGSALTTENVLKRYDRPEPPVTIDDPALLRARQALFMRFREHIGTCTLADASEREVRQSGSGLIGHFLHGQPIKKPAFLHKYNQHCRQFRKDIEDPTKDFPPILTQGNYKHEILKQAKIDEGRERLFTAKNADESDLEAECFTKMNDLFKHSKYPEFLAGMSPQKLGFDRLMSRYRNVSHIIEGDCKSFDVTAWGVIMKCIYHFRFWLWTKQLRKSKRRTFAYFLYTAEHHFVTLPTGLVVYIWWGIDSGRFNTSSDGTLYHILTWSRCLFKHYPTLPLNWWDYQVSSFMSDDHLFGLFTYQFYVQPEDRYRAYAECGLELSPADDVEFEVKNFDEDITRHTLLGMIPKIFEWNGHKVLIPVPKYLNKAVATCLRAPVKSDKLYFQRLCGVAHAGFWHSRLYKACVRSIDEGIARGLVTPSELRHETDGNFIDYPYYDVVLKIWLGLQ